MKLSYLLNQPLDFDKEIKGLSIDSRTIKAGDVFLAYPGVNSDGRAYIKEVINQQASAILMEGDEASISWQGDIPQITIPQLQKKVGELAARFYGYPAQSLRMIGITGTNGKTSCSHFLASSLDYLGIKCGVIGTLGNGLYGHLNETALTTPDPITLHKILRELVNQGAKAVAMEVSSHSLDQGRVEGIDFEIGIFTNLTQDHLDYHETMEKYGQAKQKLFDHVRYAVINADDTFGRQLIETLPAEKVVTYSTHTHAIQLALTGIRMTLVSPWGTGEVAMPLIGSFNVHNVLAVFTTLSLMGISFENSLMALSQLKPVAGRMQTLGGGEKPLVVVDYSHTPDSLEKALMALRQHCKGKLYCLFGCGGDRDRSKRPLMAAIAERLADKVMVTDDNPRTEKAESIVNDIMSGFLEASNVIVQHSRSKAIKDIIQCAQSGDCVLIAGKGAETYQQIGNEKIPFNDAEWAKETLNACLVK